MTDGPDDHATVRKAGPQTPILALPTYALVVVAGKDRGAVLRLEGIAPSRALVGQSPACDLRLSDVHVSRRHIALDRTERGLRVSDLGSTNGTLVNGIDVTEAYLRGGEVLTIGETTLRVDLAQRSQTTPLDSAVRFGRVVGASSAMRRLYPLCARVAASDVPVVIEGETGTGKEVLAESLHEASARAAGPFVVLDCTAIPPNLMESAVFGHERGAFTGAVSPRKGAFEQAHGGTLLIDEVGDLDVLLQSKLLRAIERGEVQRVGADGWTKVNVRIIAATRRDLDHAVQAGKFRDDLFFRLVVARIELPPLRERQGDVPLLARHFWRTFGGEGSIPAPLLDRFEDHTWPGNVRELSNAVARHLALGELADQGGPTLRPAAPNGPAPPANDDIVQKILSLDLPLARARQHLVQQFERMYVERVLKHHGGDVAQAAEASGIGRRYFQMLRARQSR